MRAVVYATLGAPEVLEVRDVPEPALSPGKARVRVAAAAVNPKDVLLRKGRLKWLLRAPLPRTPGYDVAGTLLDDAPGLPAGSEVFGMIQSNAGGASAEIALLRYDELARKPEGLTMAEAASIPLAGLTALQALRDGLRAEPGTSVLINGASGGVGTLAVQIAKALGARVTAVCSARNAELVRGLGADDVIDYAAQSPADARGFDAVLDLYGTLPWARAKACLTSAGRYCTAIPHASSIAQAILHRAGRHRAHLVIVRSCRSDLETLGAWVDAGVLTPVVEKTFPLGSIDDAHRHIETRRARGKVVVLVGA